MYLLHRRQQQVSTTIDSHANRKFLRLTFRKSFSSSSFSISSCRMLSGSGACNCGLSRSGESSGSEAEGEADFTCILAPFLPRLLFRWNCISSDCRHPSFQKPGPHPTALFELFLLDVSPPRWFLLFSFGDFEAHG